MRKMFTKLFGLTLLMYLFTAFSGLYAQDCDITLDNVVLLTDITTKCDSDLVQYAVIGVPSGTEYSFNGVGDTTAAGFSPDSTFWVKEGVGFVVQVRNGACYSNILPVPGEDLIQPVYVDTLLLTQARCADDQGELTVVVGGTEAFFVYFVDSTDWDGVDGTYPKYNGTQFQAEPGMKYYVTVESANGCASADWDSVTFNGAPAPVVIDSIYVSDSILCPAGLGTITVLVDTTTGIPYAGNEYMVTIEDSSKMTVDGVATFMMPAGEYWAIATDSVGCDVTSDSSAVLVDPAAITFDISLDDIACADSTDGAIYVHDFVGDADSVYLSYFGADTMLAVAEITGDTVSFPGLMVGYYSVWVGYTNGCDPVAYDNPNNTGNVISLQAPTSIDFTISIDTMVCLGESSVITASATGGSGNYEYFLDGVSSVWSDTATWTVGAGTYNAYVRDADVASCEIQADAPIVLVDPAAVVIDSVVTVSPTCPGANDGVINIAASGGVGTLMYSLDSISWKYNNIFAVAADTFTVYVKTDMCADDVAVKDTVVVVPLQENVLEIVAKDTANECYGVLSSWVEVKTTTWASQTGETRNVTVSITDGAAFNDTLVYNGSTYKIQKLTAGTYTIDAEDNFGCVSKNTLTVVITEEGQLTVSGTVTGEATCYGNYDGVMTIYAEDGTPTKYAHANTLQAANNLPDAAFTAWPAGADSVNIQVGKGTYYVVIKDACGAKAFDGPFEVDGLDPVEIDAEPVTNMGNDCYGDTDGYVEVAAATGGSEDLVYTLQQMVDGMWEDVDGYVEVESTIFENLPSDTFKVVVSDLVGGCDGTETDAFIVDGPAMGVSFTATPTDITCYGASDGTITVVATGGVGGYEFKIGSTNWRNFPEGSDTKVIVVTEPGTYTVWVRDSIACPTEGQDFTINEPSEIMLSVETTDVTAGSCATPDGVIDVTVYGGNSDTFDIYIPGLDTANMVTDSSATFTDVPAGTYTIYAVELNGNGCYAMEEVTITNPDSLSAVATVLDSVGCYGTGGGEILVEVSGGQAPYAIQLPGVDTVTGDSVVFSDLMAGSYTVTVVDASSCTYTLGTIEISQSDSIELAATWISDITCADSGQFSVEATGGSGDFIYYAEISRLPEHIIVPNPDSSSMWQAENLFKVTEPGTYIVWAYDRVNGCLVGGEDWNGVPVNEWRVKMAEPDTKVTVNAEVIGNTDCYGATFDITVPADSVVITVDGDTLATPVYTVMIDTVMNDTLSGVGPGTYIVTVTHESGCFGTDTVVIAEQEVFEVVLDKGDGEFSCPDVVEGYLEATVVSGGGDTLEYQLWQDGVLKTDYQPENSFLVRINHDYVVVVKDENGCTDTSNVMILDPVDAAAFAIKDVTCYDDTMASAKVIVTGEEGRSFRLHWNEMETSDMGVTEYFMGDTILSQFFEFDEKNTTDRHYEMWIEDSEGCTSAIDTLTFKRVDGPLQVVNVTDTVGDCATTFSFEIAGGTAPYMVMVDTTVIADSIGFYERITLNLAGGTHNVYVLDAQECELEYNFDLEYGTVLYDTVNIYAGDTAHYMENGLDTMLVGGDYEFIVGEEGCATQLFVTVVEREKTAPVLVSVSPDKDTIANNHPEALVITFSDDVTFTGEGTMTISGMDAETPAVTITLDSSMFSGNTVTVTYDAAVSGGLDKNTTYYVNVDSAAVMGDGLVWGGIADDTTWTFTTGPEFLTDVDELVTTDFKVYPNPFNSFIRIDNAEKLDRVVVTNIAGQRVLDIENPTYEIRTGNLVTGVYVVTLISNDEIVKSERIIKR
ncbi:T9SS type A sorting domain-containing protein [Maribellus sediminis]|uniref:T9SS type A sorting domain-containing protein n=1 Tax=Maribellus sediminis TaxID=2696285 RepID=UPI00143123DD|nr:T9SS type A sorting domain-containing protein [Maribellus sediminis]